MFCFFTKKKILLDNHETATKSNKVIIHTYVTIYNIIEVREFSSHPVEYIFILIFWPCFAFGNSRTLVIFIVTTIYPTGICFKCRALSGRPRYLNIFCNRVLRKCFVMSSKQNYHIIYYLLLLLLFWWKYVFYLALSDFICPFSRKGTYSNGYFCSAMWTFLFTHLAA